MESNKPNQAQHDVNSLNRREMFAAMFMQGMIASGWDSGEARSVEGWRIYMAAEAVRYSEALLAVLEGDAA